MISKITNVTTKNGMGVSVMRCEKFCSHQTEISQPPMHPTTTLGTATFMISRINNSRMSRTVAPLTLRIAISLLRRDTSSIV